MTTTAPITPLTKSEQRVAEHLVRGLGPKDIAARGHLSPHTVRSYIQAMRAKLHCPPRCPQHILVHTLLATCQVARPAALRPAPDLAPEQLGLLRALTEYPRAAEIAQAASIAPADVEGQITDLLACARADNVVHLVVLAHAWNLLSPGQGAAATPGASR